MGKPTLFLDVDSTICNSTKELVKFLNVQFNKNEDWTKVKQYNCNDIFPEVTQEQVTAVFADKMFFFELELFDGVIETLLKQQDNYNIELVTIGTSDNLYWKEKWCREKLPINFKYRGIEKFGMGKSKDVCDMSGGVIIDDHINNIVTSNADHKILYKGDYETEWNQRPQNIIAFEAKNWNHVNRWLNYLSVTKGMHKWENL